MIIYKTTNLINNKIYVGQSINDGDNNYLGSGTYIIKAIKKYGKSNFKKEIIEHCLTQEVMNNRELYWIKFFDCTNRQIGYNVRETSQGVYTKESRKKQRCKGHTEETKNKISRALKKYKRTEEHSKNLSEAIKNIDFSYMKTDVYHNNMSKATTGVKNGMFGKTHSVETKQKISESKRGKPPWNKGKDGSKYYTTMLKNYLNKIVSFYDLTMVELIDDLDQYVKKSKDEGLIPKNKGISRKTLVKYGLI